MEVKELGVRERGVRVGSEREGCESRGGGEWGERVGCLKSESRVRVSESGVRESGV